MAREIFRNSELAVLDACEFGTPGCVVTFDGYSHDRDLDRPGFGEAFFRSHGIDAVHFLSRENDWYQYPEMPDLTARVAELVGRYSHVVAYGLSMGAYAAIRFGGMAGATKALAISPQFSIDPRTAGFERRWRYDSERIDFSLERTLRAPFIDTAYILYDPTDRDRRHVDLFRRHTRVVDLPVPYVGHPATGSVAEAGLLSELVLDFVANRLDAGEFTRRIQAKHAGSSHYHYFRSERALFSRSRLAHASRAVELAPGHFGFVSNYASVLAQNDRFAEAQIVYARAAALAPDHPALLYKLTEFHELRGDWEGAIETAELLVSQHSQFRPRLERLRALEKRRSTGLASKLNWPSVTIRGKRIIGHQALPVDVRVTTTPSPPPFVESWRRHEALMERLPRAPIDLLLVGDSLVEFWPDKLWAPLSVFNFGVKADKTQNALWRLEQAPAASVDCRHAVILLGANNLGAGDTATGIAMGIAAVVAAVVRVAPRARVHVIATPPCGPDSQFRRDARRKSNAALASLEGFELIDVDADLLGVAGRSPNYADDGTHFSEAGYDLLTKLVRQKLG